jgi:hypothetical protein
MKKVLLTTVTAIVVGMAGNAAHAWTNPAATPEAMARAKVLKEWVDTHPGKPEYVPVNDCMFYAQAYKPSFQYGGSARYDLDAYNYCSGGR